MRTVPTKGSWSKQQSQQEPKLDGFRIEVNEANTNNRNMGNLKHRYIEDRVSDLR